MSKANEIVGLDCEASALEGISRLSLTRLEEMCGLRDAALDWSDIEGVHDMRVASRRLRSAIRDFKPYLKRRKHRRAGDAIKRIADSLGVVRDKDVAIAALEKCAAAAPSDAAVGIEQFASERRRRREFDRIALLEGVSDERIVSLREELEVALDVGAIPALDGKPKTADERYEPSFREAGQKIVKARIEELQGFRACLYKPFTTKPMHRMRIATKRLRYAIELFAQCWGSRLNAFSKEVGEMQTSLGELHDCDVWIEEFGGLLEKYSEDNACIEPNKTDDIDLQKCQASVWLLSYFTRKRTNHYRDALARWHIWETTDFFTRLAACMDADSNDSVESFPIALASANIVAQGSEPHDKL